MPTVRVNDIVMYYEIHGAGEPVVLIAGLNSDHTLNRQIIPQLAESYKVVAFDNRGVGQTDKPDIPYSIDMMADDTAGLLIPLMLKIPMIRGPHPYYATARQLEASRTYDCMDRLNEIPCQRSSCTGRKTKPLPIGWPKQCIPA